MQKAGFLITRLLSLVKPDRSTALRDCMAFGAARHGDHYVLIGFQRIDVVAVLVVVLVFYVQQTAVVMQRPRFKGSSEGLQIPGIDSPIQEKQLSNAH